MKKMKLTFVLAMVATSLVASQASAQERRMERGEGRGMERRGDVRPMARRGEERREYRGGERREGYRGQRFLYGGLPFYFYDGYYHGDCGWLRRRAEATGSRYWWVRFRQCRVG